MRSEKLSRLRERASDRWNRPWKHRTAMNRLRVLGIYVVTWWVYLVAYMEAVDWIGISPWFIPVTLIFVALNVHTMIRGQKFRVWEADLDMNREHRDTLSVEDKGEYLELGPGWRLIKETYSVRRGYDRYRQVEMHEMEMALHPGTGESKLVRSTQFTEDEIKIIVERMGDES